MLGYKNLGQSPKTYYGFTYPPGEIHYEAPGYINDPEFLYCGTEDDPRDFSNYPKFETVSSFLSISVEAEAEVSITFRFTITEGAVIVYFGDGTFETASGSGAHVLTHSYTEGDYTVEFTPYGGTRWSVGSVDDDVAYSIVSTNATTALPSDLTVSAFTSKGDVDRFNAVAFGYITNIESVQVPQSVITIADDAFIGCSALEEISVTDKNSNYSSVDGVLFNKSKQMLKVYPLSHGSEYVVPEGVTTVQSASFSGCILLTSVTLCSTTNSIGDDAFSGCTNLATLTSLSVTPPVLASSALTGVPADCDIFVPSDSVESYQAADNWSTRSEYIQAISE